MRRAFNWYLTGEGMLTIAKRLQNHAPPHVTVTNRLDSEGNPIFRERHPVWECNRVKTILVQRRYRGTLIDEDTFDRVQKLLARRLDGDPRASLNTRFRAQSSAEAAADRFTGMPPAEAHAKNRCDPA